jgi:hypothetical protein
LNFWYLAITYDGLPGFVSNVYIFPEVLLRGNGVYIWHKNIVRLDHAGYKKMTNTATGSAIPGISGITDGLRGINASIIDKIPFHSWPYWKEAFLGLLAVLVLYISWWFWHNFIR